MPLDNVENALLVKLSSRYLSSKNFSIRGVLLNQTIIIHFLLALLLFCRLSMTLSCSMTFHDFPMDKQTCFLNITSCKYLDCLSPHADPCRPLPLSPAPWGTSKTILIFLTVFYTDEDLHYEWGELTVLDENIAHFVLMSYEKSVTAQEFTSGMNLFSVTNWEKRRIS